MNNISSLPKGYGISAKDRALNLRIESDGKGGVDITAETDSTERKVIIEKKEMTNLIRDKTDTQSVITEERDNSKWIWLCVGVIITMTVIILLQRFFKRF